MIPRIRAALQWLIITSVVPLLALAGLTGWQVQSPVVALRNVGSAGQLPRVLDRNGIPLHVSLSDGLNHSDTRPLHSIPVLLRDAFLTSEDKRFFSHHGVDWHARMQAMHQNLKAMRAVRGASTISEQVVRILHPRPRTLWSRWLEGWEAMLLERRISKGQILEFYLNQIPYASQRRGVAQAARYYFDRDLATLTPKEMLALAVLPRAPSAWDLYRHPERANPAIARLADTMTQSGQITPATRDIILAQNLNLLPNDDAIDASHFLRYLRTQSDYGTSANLHSTLDAGLQKRVQSILNTRLRTLADKEAHNAAIIVADHRTGEILAWANGGSGEGAALNTPGAQIDAVLAPRQPGSTLKPFLYAAALERGWSPATMLEDAPLASAVGAGMHRFRNYSHSFYGSVSLREALGNSLNIPALHAIHFVGVKPFLAVLHQLGMHSLNQPEWVYDEGLALGNGEVSLLELTNAYTTLANRGETRALYGIKERISPLKNKQVFSMEAASLIGHILSDPWARRLEFGQGSVLNFPVQTAIKTGTSNDYRDAWAMGYDAHYVVGIWIGNLDRKPMQNITGSTGPALAMRSVFAELNKREPTQPLYLSPKLIPKEVCLPAAGTPIAVINETPCFTRQEYFLPETHANTPLRMQMKAATAPAQHRILRPTQNLQLAYDPRIPADAQAFAFHIDGLKKNEEVEWTLNGLPLHRGGQKEYLWQVTRGKWQLTATIYQGNKLISQLRPVDFLVK